MTFTLKIHALTDELTELYENHSTFHEGDTGVDLFNPEDKVVPPGKTIMYNLQIKCEGPMGYQLLPRSSTALKTPLIIKNSMGIIDQGYRGNINAIVHNLSNEPYTIKKGDRLFQFIAFVSLPIKIKLCDELSESSRGECGFGSTNNRTDSYI